jgi:hypothetical protein
VHDLVAELVVADRELLGVGVRVEQELGLDGLGGRRPQLFVDVLLGALLRLEVVLQEAPMRSSWSVIACLRPSTSSLTTPSGAGISAASTSCLSASSRAA